MLNDAKSTLQKLAKLAKSEKVQLQEAKSEQHFTRPPAHFTEASLVKAMESEGIGRPSTYAAILATI